LAITGTPAPGQTFNDAELDAIVNLLAVDTGSTLADVGAGSGAWAVQLARRVGPRGHVYATEVKPALLRNIQSAAGRDRAANLTVVAAEQDDPKLPDQCCDAVLMRLVYHALREPEKTLEGLRRAVKPNGRVLVIDFRPTVGELTQQMSQYGFSLQKLTDPWIGPKQIYGALFVRSSAP
jgi:ubiquinone/menaquinone biosynthesis C-methylase UbiE